MQDFGAGSFDLRKATVRSCNRFFTKRRRPPVGWRGPKACFLRESAKRFRSKVNIFAADAAADESKVARLLAGKSEGQSPVFPGLRMRIRDGAHACGRLLT